MSDGVVQVLPDSTGKKIDSSELVVGTNTVERQRIVQADPNLPGNLSNITIDGEVWVGGPALVDLLTAVLVELRVQSTLLLEIAGPRIRDDLDAMRNDAALQQTTN